MDLKLFLPSVPYSPFIFYIDQEDQVPLELVLVYIHIEVVDAVEDQLVGLSVGLPGLLATEEYKISKEAVSVSY